MVGYEMRTKETVSLCMIVKDEDDCLLAAIQSVRDLTDELIVIDTGSTDSTPQLALAAGAKLFHLTWTQDFSVARNFALEQASSDWILVLDADEVLETVNPETFYELLNNVQVEGYFLRIKNILGPTQGESHDQVVRLFRNKPMYQFEGPIHEQVAPSILRANNGNGLSSVPLTINHYGYLKDRLQSKDKFSRNSEIIKKELDRNPDNPFLLYCLGIEYYQQNSIAEGLKHLTKALVHMSGNEGYFEDVLLNIALGYLRLEEVTKLIDFLSKALNMYPDQSDFLFLRGTAYLYQTNYCKAAEDFERSLRIETIKLATLYQVGCMLGDVHHYSGNLQQAHEAYIRAYESSSTSPYPLQQLIGLIQKGYPIDFLLERNTLLEDWPKTESCQDLLESGTLELSLVMPLLTLYRTINLTPLCHRELIENLNHLLEISGSRTSESDSDNAKNLVNNYLAVALKEIHLCSLAFEGHDMEPVHFNAKNKVNIVLKDALLILCHALISNSRKNGFSWKGAVNYETSCSPCQPS